MNSVEKWRGMLQKNPTYRKKVSGKQLKILQLLFMFRFTSVPLLSEWLRKDKSTVYEMLSVLVAQGYVYKFYDNTYRLPQRPAVYSLAPPGIRYLRSNIDIGYSEAALRNMYKNKTASPALIESSLHIFTICLQLRKQYPDMFEYYTKSELTSVTTFIRPLPDLYFRPKALTNTATAEDGDDIEDEPTDYMLEILEPGIMSWLLKKRLRAHQERLEEDEYYYPTVLFVCGNENTERRMWRIISNSYFEMTIWTTTLDRLGQPETAIWRDEWDDDEVILRPLGGNNTQAE